MALNALHRPMRLTRLELRNFHIHRETDLDLDAATVIAGANDSSRAGHR